MKKFFTKGRYNEIGKTYTIKAYNILKIYERQIEQGIKKSQITRLPRQSLKICGYKGKEEKITTASTASRRYNFLSQPTTKVSATADYINHIVHNYPSLMDCAATSN